MSNDDSDFVPPDDTGAALLRSMEDGTFINAFGGEVRNAIKSLRRTADKKGGKAKGKVTLVLDLAVDAKGVLESEGGITVKLPKPTRQRSIHWTDEEGDILNRRAERQLELRVHEGSAPVAESQGAKEAREKSPPKAANVKGI